MTGALPIHPADVHVFCMINICLRVRDLLRGHWGAPVSLYPVGGQPVAAGVSVKRLRYYHCSQTIPPTGQWILASCLSPRF